MHKAIYLMLAALAFTAKICHAFPVETNDDRLEADGLNATIDQRQEEDPDPSTLTQLFSYLGCSQDEKNAVNQAFADAIEIAAAIAPTVEDVDKIDPYQWWNAIWWGKYDTVDGEEPWGQIKENLKRMRAVKDHWRLGDLYGRRYYEVRCHNENDLLDKFGNGCDRGTDGDPTAHTVVKHSVGNHYDTIVLCDQWFFNTPFNEKVARMDDPNSGYPRDNLLSLKTQGSLFLHEMLHTEYTWTDNLAGLTNPIATDTRLKNTGRQGRAYDPAKAKFLAKFSLAGMGVTVKNVDNYVYFALWHYVDNRWDVQAKDPPASWPLGTAGIDTDYPDFTEGNLDLPEDDYYATIKETLLDTGGYPDYGGKPCGADSDCEGVCPPEYTETCDVDGDQTCRCTFTFDPPDM